MAAHSDQPSHEDLDRLDLDEVKRFLARHWRLVVGVALACAVVAGLVCLALTPVYTATAQILLDPHKPHVFATSGSAEDSALDSSIVDSQIPIILSTRVLAKVAAKEDLAADPEFAAPNRAGLLARLLGLFRRARTSDVGPPGTDGIDPALAPVIGRLFAHVDVTRIAKSYVLSVSVSSRDAGKAMRLANTLAQTYVEDQVDVRSKSVGQAATFFEARLGSLRDQVRQSEQAVADYRRGHDLTTTTAEGNVTVGQQQLQDMNERLAIASADTADKLAAAQQVARFKASGADVDSLPAIVRSPVITQLRAQQADLARREADLAVVYQPGFPAIAQIRAQRAGIERALGNEMRRLVALSRNDYEVAKSREDGLRRSIGALTNASGGDNAVGVKLRELERANLANKALFENFLSRAKLTQEQSTFAEPDARLISPALEPSVPTSPKTRLIVAVAAVAGLLGGLGLAATLDRLPTRSRPRAGGPGTPNPGGNPFILGHVPGNAAWHGGDHLRYGDEHPDSGVARAIDAVAAKRPGGVTVLTPLGEGGGSALALCLAGAGARAGRRVLLVDADPARRGLSLACDLSGNIGLGEVLAGECPAAVAVVRQADVAVLPAGRKPFATAGLRAALAALRHDYDLILVDAPPLAGDPAAADLAALADAVAVVARWDELMREDFVRAVALAERPNFAGIIIERTAASGRDALALAS